MWEPIQKAAWTLVALAALVSGVACQTHVVVDPDPATGSHSAAPEHAHHVPGSHPSGETEPEDACCIPRIAEASPTDSIDSIPNATTVPRVVDERPALLPLRSMQAPIYKPPGSFRPLDQTSVLRI